MPVSVFQQETSRQRTARALVFACLLFSFCSSEEYKRVTRCYFCLFSTFLKFQQWLYLEKWSTKFVFKRPKDGGNSTAVLERPWIIFVCLPLFQMLRQVFPYMNCNCVAISLVGFEEKYCVHVAS